MASLGAKFKEAMALAEREKQLRSQLALQVSATAKELAQTQNQVSCMQNQHGETSDKLKGVTAELSRLKILLNEKQDQFTSVSKQVAERTSELFMMRTELHNAENVEIL
jgi:chromosome segregation ATPase